MIKVSVKTNTTRKELSVLPTTTPLEVFAQAGVNNVGNCSVNLNGRTLTKVELEETLENLGYKAGDEVALGAIVKADAANAR